VVVLASARHARADDLGSRIGPSDEKVRLAYQAPPGCPDRAALLEGVRARIGSAWEAREGDLARPIDVRVRSRGGRFVATIEFVDVEGQRVTRSVGGELCHNVVNGIALVTALAIESRVEEALDESEPETPATRAPAPGTPVPGPAPRVLPPPPRPRPQYRGASRGGLRGLGVTGVGPELALGAGIFGGWERGALRFGLALDLVRSPNVVRNGIPADYILASGRLEAGLGLWLSHAVGVEGVAFFEAGSLSAETREQPPRVTTAGSGSAPFAAPGLAGRLLVVADPLIATLELMGRVPLVREEFGVNAGERQRAYLVRPFSAGAALGAGVRF
jgi:hypothetical protein